MPGADSVREGVRKIESFKNSRCSREIINSRPAAHSLDLDTKECEENKKRRPCHAYYAGLWKSPTTL